MNKDEILLKIQDVFRDIFDEDSLLISAETTTNDIEGWDSLEHINIISAIEDEFEIEFEMVEITEFKSVGDMIDAVSSKLD